MTKDDVVALLPFMLDVINDGHLDSGLGLAWLFAACKACDYSFSAEYHNGLFQSPTNDAAGVDSWSEPFRDEERQGFTVSVAQRLWTEDDKQVYFPSLPQVVGAAFKMLESVLGEEDE